MAGDDENMLQEDIEGESETIHDIGKGIVAGIAGTAALGVLVLLNNALGLVPQLDLVGMLTMVAGSAFPGMGWAIFFAGGGIVLGVGFALLDSHVEATTGAGEIVRGIIFGILVWLVFMILFMPFTGAGLFAMSFGIGAPVFTFVGDVIYGAVMGWVYGALHPEAVPQ